MAIFKCNQKSCKDVFNAFLVEKAQYAGELEFPKISTTTVIPQKLIAFSKALSSSEYDAFIHFYENDVVFERLWNNPQRYLPIIKKFAGVISPDFSVYRDMPLVVQYWNIYRSRAIASWLIQNGINVIPNVRFGDSRTYICTIGIDINSTIAVGTLGCLKTKLDRKYFISGLDYVVSKLTPKRLIIYGYAPSSIFEKYRQLGIEIIHFDAEISLAHEKDDK